MLSSGNSSHIYILSGVCALLLLVGIINFVNIYLIFMMMRSKEYGIKKVFGLSRGTLFLQIWTENFLIACLALPPSFRNCRDARRTIYRTGLILPAGGRGGIRRAGLAPAGNGGHRSRAARVLLAKLSA